MQTYYLVATKPICNWVWQSNNLLFMKSPYVKQPITAVTEAMLVKNLEENTRYYAFTLPEVAYLYSKNKQTLINGQLGDVYPILTIEGPDDLFSRLSKVHMRRYTVRLFSIYNRESMGNKFEFYYELNVDNHPFGKNGIVLKETRFIGYSHDMKMVIVTDPQKHMNDLPKIALG